MTRCPNCGHDEYYRRMFVSGETQYNYRYDGAPADNSHIHDSLGYRELHTKYCCQCHTKVNPAPTGEKE